MVDSKFLLTEISNELLVPMLCWKVSNKLSFESAWLHGSSSKLCFPHLLEQELSKILFLCAMILRQAIHLSKVISGRSTYLSASTFTRSDYDLRAASYINISLANRSLGAIYIILILKYFELITVFYCFFHGQSEEWKTLPKALQTQAPTALTSSFGLVWWVWLAKFGLV